MSESLVFGSKEWLEELNRRVKFPKMFAVHCGFHKETEKTVVSSVIIETKSTEPNNLKLSSTAPTLAMALNPYHWLLEGVYYFKSDEEYLGKMKELQERWSVDFN